uniref:DUF7869 domain-containing protein n=1 Tax=Timema poppense TaxID=170557 RepID=A0A7R9CUX6_TIMPO|nr:unnamed protein product [Timema poppensis]
MVILWDYRDRNYSDDQNSSSDMMELSRHLVLVIFVFLCVLQERCLQEASCRFLSAGCYIPTRALVLDICLFNTKWLSTAPIMPCKIQLAHKDGCYWKCHKKCLDALSEEEKLTIFTHFYNDFTSKDEQDIFLQGLIEVRPIARRRSHGPVEKKKPRKSGFCYHVLNGGTRVPVCKKALINLLNIGEKRIRRISGLLLEGRSPRDGRGLNPKSHSIPGEIVELVKNHIECFPTKQSHYSGSDQVYLDSQLNVTKMYQLFVQKHPEAKVKYNFYYTYFKENYGYKFGRPQKDVCSTCEQLSVKIKSPALNDRAKRVAVAEKVVHVRRSKKFYNKLNEIREVGKRDDQVSAIVFDYMQNLPLPHVPVQEIFYFRQLWVNNFCIQNVVTGKSEMYVYHEGLARKGPNEVCSFIKHYIDYVLPKKVKVLHVFSDSCGGQNRNHTVARFLSALTVTGRFSKIFQYFPVRGHSFLPCDRDFGVIKRYLKKIDRVYTPDQYARYIAEASKKGNFCVNVINTADILDFKTWWQEHYKKTTLSVESLGSNVPKDKKVSFGISQYSMLVFDAKSPGNVCALDFIDGLQQYTFRLLHKTDDSTIRKVKLPTSKAYQDKNPINRKKIDDIRKVVQYVNSEHLGFYEEILEWPTVNHDDDDKDA